MAILWSASALDVQFCTEADVLPFSDQTDLIIRLSTVLWSATIPVKTEVPLLDQKHSE